MYTTQDSAPLTTEYGLWDKNNETAQNFLFVEGNVQSKCIICCHFSLKNTLVYAETIFGKVV